MLGRTKVQVATSHRFAGTALAEFLQSAVGVPVGAGGLQQAEDAVVIVLIGVHERSDTVPRLLRVLSGAERRVLLVYDGDRPSGDLLDAAHRLGVWGTFDVRGDPRVLADQVRTALEGRRWAQDLASMRWARALEANRSTLTPREREVVEELFSTPATTVEDVAAQLNLSPNTVRVHVANVRRKLQGRHTGNRAALHDALLELGWLD